MTDLADKKEALKKHVRALLVSSPVELTVRELERDFHTFIGIPLDYRGIGYASAEDFIRLPRDDKLYLICIFMQIMFAEHAGFFSLKY